jgi:hypothetical protein
VLGACHQRGRGGNRTAAGRARHLELERGGVGGAVGVPAPGDALFLVRVLVAPERLRLEELLSSAAEEELGGSGGTP